MSVKAGSSGGTATTAADGWVVGGAVGGAGSEAMALVGLPLERVEAEICSLAGQLAAGTCRYLLLLADFDAREGWAGWNVRSCPQWLSWRCGVDLRTAREHVRVARRLAVLPYLTEKFSAGRLSYSKVRAICRAASGSNEVALVDAALCATAAQIERLTRGMCRSQRSDELESLNRAQRRPIGVHWHWDDDGTLVLWGRLDAVDGARVLAASVRADAERRRIDAADEADDAAADTRGPAEPAQPLALSPSGDLAPALVTMAELMCTIDPSPVHAPSAEVWVHVDATAGRQCPVGVASSGERLEAVQGEAACRVDDGPGLTAADTERISCNAWIRTAVISDVGRMIGLGRRQRRPGRRLLSVLQWRDRGCLAPGCGRTRFLHSHHVRHWSRGGRTHPDNMIMLCGEHHRAVHNGVFSVLALGQQRFRFLNADGSLSSPAPVVSGTTAALRVAARDVTSDTIVPDWDGQALDLDWAVSCLNHQGRAAS